MTDSLSSLNDLQIKFEAFELFKSGMGYKKAAGELAIKQQTVRDWFRLFRGGHSTVVFTMRKGKRYPIEIREQVLDDICQNNLLVSELSAKYGVPAPTIRKWIKSYLN